MDIDVWAEIVAFGMQLDYQGYELLRRAELRAKHQSHDVDRREVFVVLSEVEIAMALGACANLCTFFGATDWIEQLLPG